MAERKKLELQLNQPTRIELLFDEPVVGESKFGVYYLYAVRNGDGATEYSFFTPDEVDQKLMEYVYFGELSVVSVLTKWYSGKSLQSFMHGIQAEYGLIILKNKLSRHTIRYRLLKNG
ncbi:MAG: hypothetical protein M0P61_15215 [Ignavibacteriaceae bacterium]|nr:hypothetical protein [Ignavibacteriaceae bacterium]